MARRPSRLAIVSLNEPDDPMPLFAIMRTLAQAVAAAMMALLFLTFVLQITVRYSSRNATLMEWLPFLEPARYGWTLEFCLVLWVWLIFWGNAFVVRDRDHVKFDILYLAVRPAVRRWFAIIAGVTICVALLAAIGPTWEKFHILRLRRTATLSSLFGGWIRMRDIYSIFILFLAVVGLRYAWAVWQAFRHGIEEPKP
jgi:C4-dicarboxylate transporter DctQ subunit